MTEILNAFIGAFSGGFDRIRPAVGGLLHVLIGLDLAVYAVMVLFDIESIRSGLRKLLVLSLWTYVIQDFDRHATSVVNSLVRAGLMAAGKGGADPHVLLDPSRILDGAFEATQPLANNLLNAGVLDLMDYFSFGVSYIFVMLAFGALALNTFLVVIEYYLALAVAGILMPFGVLQPTRWLAMKPVSFLVSSGLKLMIVSFIMAISGDVLGRITFASEEPSLREIWTMMFACGTLAMVAWIAPQRLAAGFMAGAASLGGSDAVAFGTGVASASVSPVAAAVVGPQSPLSRALRLTKAGGAAVYHGARQLVGNKASANTEASSRPPGGSHLAASSIRVANGRVQEPELVARSQPLPPGGPRS